MECGREIVNGRHSPSMNSRKFHIWVSCILSAASLAIGGYLAKDNANSFFNLENLFDHGLFVIFVFPVYCVVFYWSTYPFFRVSTVSLTVYQEHLPRDNSWPSVVFSLMGFMIPPFALIGIIAGHLTRIRLRVIKSSKKVRVALTGLILGHLFLGFWVSIFLCGFLGVFGNTSK
jgi:hypothetical protein